jgi:toxin ParE1/3/4
MIGHVIKRPQTVQDLDEHAVFLQRDSAQVAIRFLDQAESTFQLLADMPGMGRLYESGNPRLVGLRCFHVSGFENHLIFYRPVEGGIEVVRVLHGARDIRSILAQTLI